MQIIREKFTDTFGEEKLIIITIHETIEGLLSLLYETPVEELEEIESLGGYDETGKEVEIDFDILLKNTKELGCYGCTDCNANKIHIWYDKNIVREKTLLQMLSHEKAHLSDPVHDDGIEEEIKAETTSLDAVFAFGLMKRLLKNSENV